MNTLIQTITDYTTALEQRLAALEQRVAELEQKLNEARSVTETVIEEAKGEEEPEIEIELVVEEEEEEITPEIPEASETLEIVSEEPVVETIVEPVVEPVLQPTPQPKVMPQQTTLFGTAVEDIRQAISLGDRFLFQRELFAGNGELMQKTLDEINTLGSLSEAMEYISDNFDWDKESTAVQLFENVLKRRFG